MNRSKQAMLTGWLAALLLVAGIAVIIAISAGVYRKPVETAKEPPASTPTEAVVPKQATLEGTYTCLPHRDTSGPQTMECAIGLEATDQKYYALDLSGLTPDDNRILQTGSGVTVQGLLTPIEMISSNQWQKYNVSGIMKVEMLLER